MLHRHLLAVSAADTSLAAYRLDASGRATLTSTIGVYEGFSLSTPTLIATARMAGRDLVLVGSGSIAVAELTGAGCG